MTISSVQSATYLQQSHRSAPHPEKASEKGVAVQGDRTPVTPGSRADYAVTTPSAIRGMDLGALLPARENAETRGVVPGSQKAYADAVQATAEEALLPFAAHYGEAEYSLNP